MNFFNLSQTLEGYATLTIQSHYCTNVLNAASSCHTCQDICPAHALHFDGKDWTALNCIGCGLCVTTCPTHVFRLDEDLLLSNVTPKATLSVSCHHNPSPVKTTLTINCLQQLYPELILRLTHQCQQVILYVDQSHCDNCPNGWLAQSLSLQLAMFGLPLDNLLIVTSPNELKKHLKSENTSLDRRLFFQQLFHDTKIASKKAVVTSADRLLHDIPSVSPSDEPLPMLPIRRVPLKAIYQEHDIKSIAQQELPYSLLHTDFCTFCGACATLCPTQALTLHETENRKELLFNPILCTQCNLCQDICIHKQLYWFQRLTIEQFLSPAPLVLAAAYENICSDCEHTYWQYPPTEDTRCSFCRR